MPLRTKSTIPVRTSSPRRPYGHNRLFDSPERLTLLEDLLLGFCNDLGWRLQQWAVFANHYHFVALSPETDGNTANLIRRLHGKSAIELNKLDGTPGRKVWHERWDTRLTFEKSYLARLNYVRTNPVRHGLVSRPEDYPWCSAEWFAQKAERPWFETIRSFAVDAVNVPDAFGDLREQAR